MPEGPETKRAADQLVEAIESRRVEAITFAFPRLQREAAALRGQTVSAVRCRGKAMLIQFPGGQTIYSHNQLYGVWRVAPAGVRPSTGRELRLAIDTPHRSALLYSASDIDVLRTEQVADHPYVRRLGIELLDPETTVPAVVDWIRRPGFAGRALGALLLDQGFLAGVGNYLRSEILYVAGLHPAVRPRDLGAADIEAVATAAHSLSWQSYRTRGITNDLERAQRLKRAGQPFGRYRHWVFDREGGACYHCGDTIVREIHGTRQLYRCPTCQPARKR